MHIQVPDKKQIMTFRMRENVYTKAMGEEESERQDSVKRFELIDAD